MPLYCCDSCNISTKLLSNFNRHLKTAKHLNNIKKQTPLSEKTSENTEMYTQCIHKSEKCIHNVYTKYTQNTCDLCEKIFSSRQSLWRHKQKYCKVKKNNEAKVEELEIIVQEQKEQINKLINKVGTTNITTTNINNTQNIQLNSYGNEDMSHITDSLKNQLLKIPYGMIPKMIEAVHFNNQKPENKNILLPNKKDNKIKVYKDNKWIYRDKEETIRDLMDGKYFILDSHYEDNFNNLSSDDKNNYKKFQNNFTDEFESIKKECELILLNNR